MAQYKASDITNICWACNDGFKAGRDPMGIQNSSVATYSCLLPGLTNLTGHIRYYSLYCWLLAEYDRLPEAKQLSLHQYNFIRRAELTMAFVMKDQGVGAVIGARFIQSQSYEKEDDIYLIYSGADYEESNRYWTFTTGAFGQYYLGSLIYFDLVKLAEERFYLCNKGKALAQAFADSVDKKVRDLFLECIVYGGITEEEIIDLQPIGLHRITTNSPEWTLLNGLMTQQDSNGSTLRRDTIRLMLKDISAGVRVSEFALNRFLQYDAHDTSDASFGWYFYYLCEALHYAIETLLCFVLTQMDELHNPSIRRLIDDTQEKMLSHFSDLEASALVKDYEVATDDTIDGLLDETKGYIKQREYSKAASKAVRLLLRLHDEDKDNGKDIRKFEERYGLKRQRGIFSDGLEHYVYQHLDKSMKDYITSLIQQVMNEHTVIAVAKMGHNNPDLRKFIIEDGCAVLVEVRYPNTTSPRTESLHNFLVDLHYLDDNDNLTAVANQYIDGRAST